MNLFILDEDPSLNAIYHVDRHVVKMPLEAAQLLSNAFWINQGSGGEYKFTHGKHPLSIWVAKDKANFFFTGLYGLSLCNEYTYRYKKIHGCERLLTSMLEHPPVFHSESTYVTEFCQCVPVEMRIKNADLVTTIEVYRRYYKEHKNHLFKWKNRDNPSWI